MRVVKGLLVGVGVFALVVGAGVSRSDATELDLSGASGACTSGAGTTGSPTCSSAGGGYWNFVTAGTAGNTATGLFSVTNTQPTGTGYIDSFLRIQDANSGGSNPSGLIVDGMNNSLPQNKFLGDEKPGPYTKDVQFGSMQAVTVNGTSYYQFLLDINQTGTDPLLTLSGLQVCAGSAGGQEYSNTCAGSSGSKTSTLLWDLDGNVTSPFDAGYTADNTAPVNTVLLDYNKNSGSGSGDMFFYLPTSLFTNAGVKSTDYLYLWSQFGRPLTGPTSNPYNNNDGFEEWAYNSGTGPSDQFNQPGVPEPGSLILLGTGLLIGANSLRKRRAKKIAA